MDYKVMTIALTIGTSLFGCNNNEGTREEVRLLAEEHILASGDFMADSWYEGLQSDSLEEVCSNASWGTTVRLGELMSRAGYSFSPGAGFWLSTTKPSEEYRQQARELDEVRQEIYDLCYD